MANRKRTRNIFHRHLNAQVCTSFLSIDVRYLSEIKKQLKAQKSLKG